MQRSRRILHMAAAVAVAVLLAVQASTAQAAVTKAPYLQNMTSGGVTVQYEATDEAAGVVRFAAAAALDQKADFQMIQKVVPTPPKPPKGATDAAPAALPPVYLYRAHLTGLKPDTEYRYEVTHGAGAALAAKTFRTFPDKPVPITFIAYGDSRSNPKAHHDVASGFAAHKPLFILHDGDLIADEKDYSLWDREFFGPLVDVIDHVPLAPVRGNHEGSGVSLHELFEMGGDNGWFSFDCGPVHVAMLDNYDTGQAQLDWLEKDLAAAKAPWKIVMYHEPTFNFAGHKSADRPHDHPAHPRAAGRGHRPGGALAPVRTVQADDAGGRGLGRRGRRPHAPGHVHHDGRRRGAAGAGRRASSYRQDRQRLPLLRLHGRRRNVEDAGPADRRQGTRFVLHHQEGRPVRQGLPRRRRDDGRGPPGRRRCQGQGQDQGQVDARPDAGCIDVLGNVFGSSTVSRSLPAVAGPNGERSPLGRG